MNTNQDTKQNNTANDSISNSTYNKIDKFIYWLCEKIL